MRNTEDFRREGPNYTKIRSIKLPPKNHYSLDNGLDVYEMNMGTQPVLKLEFVFESGRTFEAKQLAGRVSAAMIKEGIQSKSSEAIAEFFDYYGASFQSTSGMDTGKFVLYCLEKHLETLLPVVKAMLTEPIFPRAEFEHFIQNAKQKIDIDQSRNEIVSYRSFTEKIYGETHPYGYNSTVKGFDVFDLEDAKTHFDQNYWTKGTKFFVSGLISDNTRSLLNQYFGDIPLKPRQDNIYQVPTIDYSTKTELLAPNNIQASLRIGGHLFSRNHADYAKMFLTSMILGGYFGSRLMKNIREDKGYTYSIFSGLDTMRHDGYFYISTELDNQYAEPAIAAIYKEIDILKSQLVTDGELEMVKNYMMGSFLNMVDGAFNASRLLKTLVLSGQEYDSFTTFVNELVAMSAFDIQHTANKYFDTDKFLELTVINRNA